MTEKTDQEKKSGGIIGDVRNVKTSGFASLSELRAFIGSLKGRKPQEILGAVANNSLVQATVISTIGFVVVLLVFTAIPYYMSEPVTKKEKKPTVTKSDNQAADKAKSDNKKKDDMPSKTADGKTGDKVLDKLGIGETKKADPKTNPLGNKFNELLEDIE